MKKGRVHRDGERMSVVCMEEQRIGRWLGIEEEKGIGLRLGERKKYMDITGE